MQETLIKMLRNQQLVGVAISLILYIYSKHLKRDDEDVNIPLVMVMITIPFATNFYMYSNFLNGINDPFMRESFVKWVVLASTVLTSLIPWSYMIKVIQKEFKVAQDIDESIEVISLFDFIDMRREKINKSLIENSRASLIMSIIMFVSVFVASQLII